MKNIVMLLIFVISLTGCQTTGEVKNVNSPPSWLKGDPRVGGMICAVGMSEPTYYKKDALRYAADNARKELARTLSLKINTLMIDINSEKESSINEGSTMEVSSWATDTVVENSEILEYWIDSEGSIARKNSAFALGCIPRKYARTTDAD